MQKYLSSSKRLLAPQTHHQENRPPLSVLLSTRLRPFPVEDMTNAFPSPCMGPVNLLPAVHVFEVVGPAPHRPAQLLRCCVRVVFSLPNNWERDLTEGAFQLNDTQVLMVTIVVTKAICNRNKYTPFSFSLSLSRTHGHLPVPIRANF